MENQNKVATVGKDGVSAKQTESQTKPLMITGMDAIGFLPYLACIKPTPLKDMEIKFSKNSIVKQLDRYSQAIVQADVISEDRKNGITLDMLIDTGCYYTLIPELVLISLGYNPIGEKVSVSLPNGQLEMLHNFKVPIKINGLFEEYVIIDVYGLKIISTDQYISLLGCQLLSLFEFKYNIPLNHFTLKKRES